MREEERVARFWFGKLELSEEFERDLVDKFI